MPLLKGLSDWTARPRAQNHQKNGRHTRAGCGGQSGLFHKNPRARDEGPSGDRQIVTRANLGTTRNVTLGKTDPRQLENLWPMQANEQNRHNGSGTRSICDQAVRRTANGGVKFCHHGMFLLVCCLFVLKFTMLCKELFENICELFRTSTNDSVIFALISGA